METDIVARTAPPESGLRTVRPLMPDTDFAAHDLTDLHERLAELRRHGPIVPVIYHGDPVWLLLDHGLLVAALGNENELRASDGYIELSAPFLGRHLLTMDGEEHRVNRGAIAASFQPAQARRLAETLIAEVAHDVCDEIEGAREIDFMPAFAQTFAFRVITRLLGIPVNDEALLIHWSEKLFDMIADPEGGARAKAGFDAYMLAIVEERRRNPQDDFVSMIVSTRFEGGQLDDESILSFFRLLFPAGAGNVYRNAGTLFARVLADPAVRALASEGDAQRSAIVAEGLRWETPNALIPRMAAKDVRIADVDVRGGDWMLFGITAGNNDPAIFPDPRRFDPSRDNRHMISFGRGAHFCIGAHLARRELETALRIVLERFPAMRLMPGKVVEYVSTVLRGPRELWVQPYGEA